MELFIRETAFKEIDADVLVVGSGLAGVMAAVKAARMGCKVVLASKGSMRSGNSILVGGGWLVPSKDFPQTDDDHCLKKTLLALDRKTGDVIVTYRPAEGN